MYIEVIAKYQLLWGGVLASARRPLRTRGPTRRTNGLVLAPEAPGVDDQAQPSATTPKCQYQPTRIRVDPVFI